MKPGEPIGKWFIENISFTHETEFEIYFKNLAVSYSDGKNTYYLGGNDYQVHYRGYYHLLYIVSPIVNLSLLLILDFNQEWKSDIYPREVRML